MVPEAISLFTQKTVLHTFKHIRQKEPSVLINTIFKQIYVITTTKNLERQKTIESTLAKLGINYTLYIMNPPSEELYAIYEKWYYETVEPKQKAIDRKPTNFAKLSPGELGCCASHIFLLTHIANTQTDKSLSLILEDDVVFIENFEERLKSAQTSISNCQLFTLGTNDYNIKNRNIITNNPTTQHIYHPNPEHGILYGMHAYAIQPQMAKQFITYINTFLRPCDHYLWLMFNILNAEEGLAIWPPLVIQDRTTSTLRDVNQEQNTETYYFKKCLPGLDKSMYKYIQTENQDKSINQDQDKSINQDQSLNQDQNQETIIDAVTILHNKLTEDKNYPITVVLVYFNPAKYISRKANFEYMIKHLITHPVSEIILVSPTNTKPELTIPLDSRIKIIEVDNDSVFFMKESLQNKGWKESNKTNPYVLFMDTDIIFETPWIEKLTNALENADVVQAWHKASLLDNQNTVVHTEQSWGSIAKTKPKSQEVTSFKAHTGFAWAFRRDFLESIGDLNIHCVIGSGDQILARSLINTEFQPRHAYMKNSYEKFVKNVQTNLKRGFSYLEGVHIKHLYHGDLHDRKYYERHIYLNEIRFSENELIKKDSMIEFKDSQKWNAHFSKYFSERNEDKGFYTYCIVKKGAHIQCATAVQKSDMVITIKNQTEESYIKLLKLAEMHPGSTLFIHELEESGLLSNNVLRIDSTTKERLSQHVLYKYTL